MRIILKLICLQKVFVLFYVQSYVYDYDTKENNS